MFKEATWKIEMMAHISKSTTGGYLLESYLSKSPKQKKNIVAKWEHIPKTEQPSFKAPTEDAYKEGRNNLEAK